MIGQQNQMFQGYSGYAQGIGGGGQYPPQAQMAPQYGLSNVRPGGAGMYGEQVAMRMSGVGRTTMAGAGYGMQAAGGLMGIPMDPMGGAMMGALGGMGGGVGGAMMGAAIGTGVGAGIYGATKVAGAYWNAFQGGIQDQTMMNAGIRSNFQQFGGQGANGRGFGQNQMGQIGSMISQELKGMPTSSVGEMTGLIVGGAQGGLMTGTRDVQTFTQNFRKMLDTLKSVQKELGGSLTEALSFVRSSQQAGIYQNADRVNFAGEIRSAEAVTGMDRNQLIALSAQGSQISRAYGGQGRQGATGILRAVQGMGAAISSGAISEELLSNATGGLTGTDAMAAFAARTMQRSGQFSKTAQGRYSLFAMSNRDGSGIDEGMRDQFLSGNISVGDVRGAAHRNVGSMGRARALNQEGFLRGALMEDGGTAAQIGMMKLRLGDRVMDQGDEVAQIVMRRKFHMSQDDAKVWSSMMRNQEKIADRESLDRAGASRVQARTADAADRSFDTFARQLEDGLSDATGLTKAKELGMRFTTKVSSFMERTMNDLMGVATGGMTATDYKAYNRVLAGTASSSEMRSLNMMAAGGTGENVRDPAALSVGQRILKGLGFEVPDTRKEALAARGAGTARGPGDTEAARELEAAQARQGIVSGRAEQLTEAMVGNDRRTQSSMRRAEMIGQMMGNMDVAYAAMGGTRDMSNAVDASRARMGLSAWGSGIPGDLGGPQKDVMGAAMRDVGKVSAAFAAGPLGITALAIGLATGSVQSELYESGKSPAERQAEGLRGWVNETATAMELTAGRDIASVRNEDSELAKLYAGDPDKLRAARVKMFARNPSGTVQERARVASNVMAVQAGQMRETLDEGLESLSSNDQYKEQVGRIMAASDTRTLQVELDALGRLGSTQTGPGAAAVTAMTTLLTRDVQNNQGALSAMARGNLGASMVDKDKAREAENMRQRTGAMLGRAAERLESSWGTTERAHGARTLEGGLMMPATAATHRDDAMASQDITFQRALAEQSRLFMSNDATFEQRRDASAATIGELSRMDPASEQYRRASAALGTGEEASTMRRQAARQAQEDRNISGRGRRGKRGAEDAGLGLLTGHTIGDMTFTVVGHGGRTRTLHGGRDNREIARLAFDVTGDGSVSRSMREQLTQQINERSGLEGAAGAGAAVDNYMSLRSGGIDTGVRHRDRVDADGNRVRETVDNEVTRVRNSVRDSNAAIETRQAENEAKKIKENQEKNDPLGVKRNALLTQMTTQNSAIAGILMSLKDDIKTGGRDPSTPRGSPAPATGGGHR